MNPLCEEQGTAVASDSGPERCVHHLHPEERSNGIQRKVPLPSVARGEQDARAGCPNNSLVRTRVRAVTLKLPDGRGGTKPKKNKKRKKKRGDRCRTPTRQRGPRPNFQHPAAVVESIPPFRQSLERPRSVRSPAFCSAHVSRQESRIASSQPSPSAFPASPSNDLKGSSRLNPSEGAAGCNDGIVPRP